MKTPPLRRWLANVHTLRIVRVLGALLLALAVAWFVVLPLTPTSLWIDRGRFTRSRDAFAVTDRHGAPLRQARVDGVDRRWVDLREVSPNLVDAVLAAEDARFFEHHGVDGFAMMRALVTSVNPWRRTSGASTITQQLVKRVYGRPHGLWSKPIEIVRAMALERVFSKQEILEQYLNRVPFGDRIEGVARASEEYLGHPVSTLSVGEAALLAGIPQAPSATEPRRHRERAIRRRNHVLSRLAKLGKIGPEEQARFVAESPAIRDVAAHPNEAPRFVDAALMRWSTGQIERHDGSLRTSIDLEVQHRAEEIVGEAVKRFESRGVTNGAVVVIANTTGEVLAYVGAARSGAAAPGGGLDLLQARRQPGSTLKPFVYELFFERGGTAATVLDDISVARKGAHGETFEARDYDGRERGPVRARVALASSLNLAALDVAGRVGQDAIVTRLGGLGFHTPHRAAHYGAAIVLGGLDVAPIELAGAYMTLARGGTRAPISFVPGAPVPGERVMTVAAAELTRDVLSDARSRADGFGADLSEIAGRFALKTGTSAGWRDAWAATFDEHVTVVVWLGDPSGRPLGGVSGFEAAAPAAARILSMASARVSSRDIKVASGAATSSRVQDIRMSERLVPVSICAASGLRPGAGCRHVIEEKFAPGTTPKDECTAHDERGDLVLPARYSTWVNATHPIGISKTVATVASTQEEPVVREPHDGARWLIDAARGNTVVPLRATVAGITVADVNWEVDGKLIPGSTWEISPGEHGVVAIWHGRRSQSAHVVVDRR